MAQSRGYEGVTTKLYVLVLILTSLSFVASLGGGVFHQEALSPYQRFTRAMFHQVCHQVPERGLVVNGTPTAVCSRCLGIYGGTWAGILVLGGLVGIFAMPLRTLTWSFRAILAALGIIALDVVGNGLGLWTNTHLSRILTGVFLGLAVSWLLAGELQYNKNLKD